MGFRNRGHDKNTFEITAISLKAHWIYKRHIVEELYEKEYEDNYFRLFDMYKTDKKDKDGNSIYLSCRKLNIIYVAPCLDQRAIDYIKFKNRKGKNGVIQYDIYPLESFIRKLLTFEYINPKTKKKEGVLRREHWHYHTSFYGGSEREDPTDPASKILKVKPKGGLIVPEWAKRLNDYTLLPVQNVSAT